MACTRVGAYCIRPIAWPVAVCETTMQHLRSVAAVCETTMHHLRSVAAVCEMTMQHLRSVVAVCETTMQHPHSVVAVCETTMQHLHSVVAVCEATMQHLRSVVAVCERITQHLHSLFVMCAPTTGTIIHPCGMSGGRMQFAPTRVPGKLRCPRRGRPYTGTRPNFAAPAGAAPTCTRQTSPASADALPPPPNY